METPPPDNDSLEYQAFFSPVPSDPIIEKPLIPERDPFFSPEPEQAPAPVMLPPVEEPPFTGVRVYGDAYSCNPCRYLHRDLRFLQEKHGWTLSESESEPADWQILPPRESDRRIPLIEFWQGGQLVDRETGYTDAPAFDARRPVLLELVRRHPVRQNGAR